MDEFLNNIMDDDDDDDLANNNGNNGNNAAIAIMNRDDLLARMLLFSNMRPQQPGNNMADMRRLRRAALRGRMGRPADGRGARIFVLRDNETASPSSPPIWHPDRLTALMDERLRLHDTFARDVLGGIHLSTSPSLSMLNQGLETSNAIQRSIAEYLGVSFGASLAKLRRARHHVDIAVEIMESRRKRRESGTSNTDVLLSLRRNQNNNNNNNGRPNGVPAAAANNNDDDDMAVLDMLDAAAPIGRPPLLPPQEGDDGDDPRPQLFPPPRLLPPLVPIPRPIEDMDDPEQDHRRFMEYFPEDEG